VRLVDGVVPVMTTVLPVAAVRSTAVAEAISAPVERVCKPVNVLVPRVAAVPVIPAAGSPVALVRTKADGVPNAGAVNTGEVKVLLVSVSDPVLVTRFVGVIMSDKLAMFFQSSIQAR
jgi:hypothetical protein